MFYLPVNPRLLSLPSTPTPLPSLPPLQLEDGHSLFDYDVGLNDIIQLMIRPASATHTSQQNGGRGQGEGRENGEHSETAEEMETVATHAQLVSIIHSGSSPCAVMFSV